MKKIIALVFAVVAMVSVGCSQTVDSGYVAKKVTTSGVQPEIYQTGRVWMGPLQRLVLIDVSTQLRQAPVNVIMADNFINDAGEVQQRIGLEMSFIVNVRYRISDQDRVIDAAMRDMTLDNTNKITADMFYQKYGNMVVGRVSREVLGRYTPEEVLENLPTINAMLQDGIRSGLQGSPLVVSEVSLGPIQLPKVISDRINLNKDVELSEASARSQQRIDLLERQNQIELARQRAVQEEIDARSLANQNSILAQSTTPEVIRLRELENQRLQIEMMREVAGRSGSTVFLPYDAMSSIGAQTRMFQQ